MRIQSDDHCQQKCWDDCYRDGPGSGWDNRCTLVEFNSHSKSMVVSNDLNLMDRDGCIDNFVLYQKQIRMTANKIDGTESLVISVLGLGRPLTKVRKFEQQIGMIMSISCQAIGINIDKDTIQNTKWSLHGSKNSGTPVKVWTGTTAGNRRIEF